MTIQWTGNGATNSWNNAGNWSGDMVPYSYDSVTIGSVGSLITVAIPSLSTPRAGSLTIGNGGNSETVQLDLAGAFTLNGGTLAVVSGAGLITRNGAIDLNGGDLSVASGASCTIMLTFTTAAPVTTTANLILKDASSGLSQTVVVNASANYPSPSVSPSIFSFGTISVGTSSAPQSMTVTGTLEPDAPDPDRTDDDALESSSLAGWTNDFKSVTKSVPSIKEPVPQIT